MRSIFSKRTNHWANWDRLGPTLIIKTHIVSIVLFLLPIHLLFIKIKNYLYDKNIVSPTKVDATVISVGNISLGGAGKTPFTIALSNFLAQRGKSVGVLTRGYGRKSGGDFLLKNHSVEEAGDETIVLKNNLSKSIPIYVSKNKILGANALASLGCEIIILDDAFQHRKIYRDIDVVLVNPDELQEKNKKFLGIQRFNYITLRNNIKIFGLGGIKKDNIRQLKLFKINGFGGKNIFKNVEAITSIDKISLDDNIDLHLFSTSNGS